MSEARDAEPVAMPSADSVPALGGETDGRSRRRSRELVATPQVTRVSFGY
jgi:hypothetical protein